MIENTIAEKNVKPILVLDENSKNIEEIDIKPEKSKKY